MEIKLVYTKKTLHQEVPFFRLYTDVFKESFVKIRHFQMLMYICYQIICGKWWDL